MPKICDRSPCDDLMKALGDYIYGTVNGSTVGGFILTPRRNAALMHEDAPRDITIHYCPFCGTRLEEINATVLKRFTAQSSR